MTDLTSHSTVVFLKNYNYSASSTSNFKTNIVEIVSGIEKRKIEWIQSLETLDVSFTIRDKKLTDYVNKYYKAMFGPAFTFPVKNWIECYCFKEDGVVNVDNNYKLNGFPTCKLFKKYQVDISKQPNFKAINIIAQAKDEAPSEYLPFTLYNNGVEATFSYFLDYDTATLNLPLISSFNVSSINLTTNTITTSTPHNFLIGDLIYFDLFTPSSVLNQRVFTVTSITSTTFTINVSLSNLTVGSNGRAFKYLQDQEGTNYNLTWQGEFFYKMRFSDDQMTITWDTFGTLSVPVKLKEVL